MSFRKINIDGQEIGISNLDETLTEIRDLQLGSEHEIAAALLAKIKQHNYIPPGIEAAYRQALLEEYKVLTGQLKERQTANDTIRVFGPGCVKCEQLDRMVKEILIQHNLKLDYQYVKDIKEMSAQGIGITPAMTINGKLLVSGRVPKKAQVERLILKSLGK